jgi:protein TonB
MKTNCSFLAQFFTYKEYSLVSKTVNYDRLHKLDERFFFAVSCFFHLCLLLAFSSKVFDLSFSSPKHSKSASLSTEISIQKSFDKKETSKLIEAKKQSAVKPQKVLKKIAPLTEQKSLKKDVADNEKSTPKDSSTFVADFSNASTKAPKELQKFFKSLISEIHNKKSYPRLSKKLRESGTVYIKFMVDSNGEIKDTTLIKSSKYQRLNNSALNVVSQLEIKEPLPNNYDKIVITFPMSYIL